MIRPAERHEIDKYLSARNAGCMEVECDSYIASAEDCSMLFTVKRVSDSHCEMHICCPKASVRLSRLMTEDAIRFSGSLGYTHVFTAVNNNKYRAAHNMAEKLRFRVYDITTEYTIYERSI